MRTARDAAFDARVKQVSRKDTEPIPIALLVLGPLKWGAGYRTLALLPLFLPCLADFVDFRGELVGTQQAVGPTHFLPNTIYTAVRVVAYSLKCSTGICTLVMVYGRSVHGHVRLPVSAHRVRVSPRTHHMLLNRVFVASALRSVFARPSPAVALRAPLTTSVPLQLAKSAEKPKAKPKRATKPATKSASKPQAKADKPKKKAKPAKKDKPWEARDANGKLRMFSI